MSMSWCLWSPYAGIGHGIGHSSIITKELQLLCSVFFHTTHPSFGYRQCAFGTFDRVVGLTADETTTVVDADTMWSVRGAVCKQFRDKPHIFVTDDINVLDVNEMVVYDTPHFDTTWMASVCDADSMRGYLISRSILHLLDWHTSKIMYKTHKQNIVVVNAQRAEDSDNMVAVKCYSKHNQDSIHIVDTRCADHAHVVSQSSTRLHMLDDRVLVFSEFVTGSIGKKHDVVIVSVDLRTTRPLFRVMKPELDNIKFNVHNGRLFAYMGTTCFKFPQCLVLSELGVWNVPQ